MVTMEKGNEPWARFIKRFAAAEILGALAGLLCLVVVVWLSGKVTPSPEAVHSRADLLWIVARPFEIFLVGVTWELVRRSGWVCGLTLATFYNVPARRARQVSRSYQRSRRLAANWEELVHLAAAADQELSGASASSNLTS